MRQGARVVLKWFSLLYVVLIVIQVYLAGEGIFGLNAIRHSDDCNKTGATAHDLALCNGTSKTLDAHRALGFFLTFPGAILFLICALIAWHPNMRVRVVSILVAILTFVQMILPGAGRWGGALHPVNALLILGMYLWLFLTLRKQEAPEAAEAPATAPTG
jgi:hypothetical protein